MPKPPSPRRPARPRGPRSSAPSGSFTAKLWRYPGPGGWHFVTVPERLAPPATHGWGRTPVHATVDGSSWNTSVWRDKGTRTLLAIPARIRRGKEDGDAVTVALEFADLAPAFVARSRRK